MGAWLITPSGIRDGAVRIARGRIAAIKPTAPPRAAAVSLKGSYLAPGFINLHVWGEPAMVAREEARHGTTAFLSAIGPGPHAQIIEQLEQLRRIATPPGARCLGAHLEGPFLNPRRAGALPARWMRSPTLRELRAFAAVGSARLMTIAPERSGALDAIRWCRHHHVVASLGHSTSDAATARQAAAAGARAVTHVFNGMLPFHQRRPGLLDVALTDPRLVAMVIADGVHVSPSAVRLLVQAKGPEGIALVTDSIAHQHPHATLRRGAFYTRDGTLAGSCLTMIEAVRNAMRFGRMSIVEAVRMATEVPAKLLGIQRAVGALVVGKRADFVAFDQQFRVALTIVGGRIVYRRSS